MPVRIGFFGGSFDPVHFGHLILAETCRQQAGLDQVLFVPAALSPAKTNSPTAGDKQRLEMLTLAIAGNTAFEISTIELDRGGTSFTVDTLSELRSQQPRDEWYLLIGEDSLVNFATWRQPKSICEMAMPLVVRRQSAQSDPEAPLSMQALQPFMSAERFSRAQSETISSRLIEISSSDIRARTQQHLSIRYLVPRAVEKYIETQHLYRDE